MAQYFGIEVPDEWKDIKWVETLEGCFTPQVFIDGKILNDKTWNEDQRKLLCEMGRQFLQKTTGIKLEKYNGS